MLKKLTLLAMSVAALLAFAAPAAHATGPLVHNSLGEAATSIKAVSSNTVSHTSIGTLECTTVNLAGNITTNKETTASGSGSGTATGTPKAVPATHTGHCGSSSGNVVEVTSVELSNIHLTKHAGVTTGTASFKFTFDLRSSTESGLLAKCVLGTSATHVVTVTRTGADTIRIHGNIQRLTQETHNSILCPSTGTIAGDFTVTDNAGVPVNIT